MSVDANVCLYNVYFATLDQKKKSSEVDIVAKLHITGPAVDRSLILALSTSYCSSFSLFLPGPSWTILSHHSFKSYQEINFNNMFWKKLLSFIAILAYIQPVIGAPKSGAGLTNQTTDKYVFAHFMVRHPFRTIIIILAYTETGYVLYRLVL
jgi:hypothetical protein